MADGRLEAAQSQATCCWDRGVSRNVVSTQWKKLIEIGTVVHRPGEGHKRATTPAQYYYLRLLAKRDKSVTATQMYHNLCNITEISFSRIIVIQRQMQEASMPGTL
ncbi:HTH_Tnp_Tc3_2 domain-containing protein [Trichonephila clavipes]|nr:HTH_Tnp_Tc3_2 domain-containing protein [Trichonephila clavipes]